MKKLLAVILAVLTVLSLGVPALAADAAPAELFLPGGSVLSARHAPQGRGPERPKKREFVLRLDFLRGLR